MRCYSIGFSAEVLNENFSCTWTLCSTQSGDGWPQRSQLQSGIPSLGRCVTLLPAAFCNLSLGDPLSSCNKRIVFIVGHYLQAEWVRPTAVRDFAYRSKGSSPVVRGALRHRRTITRRGCQPLP